MIFSNENTHTTTRTAFNNVSGVSQKTNNNVRTSVVYVAVIVSMCQASWKIRFTLLDS